MKRLKYFAMLSVTMPWFPTPPLLKIITGAFFFISFGDGDGVQQGGGVLGLKSALEIPILIHEMVGHAHRQN